MKISRYYQQAQKVSYSIIISLLLHTGATANPAGPTVVHGNAVIQNHGNQLTVTNTPGTIIDWQTFSISADEITRFNQQNSNSAVLNRVTGRLPSDILGQLTSNGKVFVINPNGLVIGKGARIDTAGFLASTLDISNEDFLAGRLQFRGEGGKIENYGYIRAGKGGEVVLIAPQIRNEGIIETESGEILLAAGHEVTLTSLDDADIAFIVAAKGDKVLNLGRLLAENGAVRVFADQISMGGTVSANRVRQGADGSIILEASSSVEVTGSLSAEGQGVDGGRIHILGQQVRLNGADVSVSGRNGGSVLVGGNYQGKGAVKKADTTLVSADSTISADGRADGPADGQGNGGEIIVWSEQYTNSQGRLSARGGELGGNGGLIETSSKKKLDFGQPADVSAPNGEAGTWLIDPEDIVIGSSEAASVSSALNNGSNVTIQTSDSGSGEGNITVAAPISKTEGPDASLSLDAHNRIEVNAPITSSEGKLDVNLEAGGSIAVNATVSTNGGDFNATVTGAASSTDEPEDTVADDDTGSEDTADTNQSDGSDSNEAPENNTDTELPDSPDTVTEAEQPVPEVLPEEPSVAPVDTPDTEPVVDTATSPAVDVTVESSPDAAPDVEITNTMPEPVENPAPESTFEPSQAADSVDVAQAEVTKSDEFSSSTSSEALVVDDSSGEEVGVTEMEVTADSATNVADSQDVVTEESNEVDVYVDDGRSQIVIRGEVDTAGGEISIDASTDGDVVVSGRLDSSSDTEQGGDITIEGERIALVDEAVVDASGEGGGEVLIGGGQQGQDESVQNAQFVYVSKDAKVHADGGENGDGGRMILFSEDTTMIEGNITARGGRQQGDGGFIETSGLQNLRVSNAPDASASNGANGTWLIDPTDITITNSPDININLPVGTPWLATGSGANIAADTIKASLGLGVNVEITTQSALGQDGDISWQADMDLDGNTQAASLTLKADNNIIITGSIFDSNLGNGDSRVNDLTLLANRSGNGGGIAVLNAGGDQTVIDVKGTLIMDTSHASGSRGSASLKGNQLSGVQVTAQTINITANNLTVDGEVGDTVLAAENLTMDLSGDLNLKSSTTSSSVGGAAITSRQGDMGTHDYTVAGDVNIIAGKQNATIGRFQGTDFSSGDVSNLTITAGGDVALSSTGTRGALPTANASIITNNNLKLTGKNITLTGGGDAGQGALIDSVGDQTIVANGSKASGDGNIRLTGDQGQAAIKLENSLPLQTANQTIQANGDIAVLSGTGESGTANITVLVKDDLTASSFPLDLNATQNISAGGSIEVGGRPASGAGAEGKASAGIELIAEVNVLSDNFIDESHNINLNQSITANDSLTVRGAARSAFAATPVSRIGTEVNIIDNIGGGGTQIDNDTFDVSANQTITATDISVENGLSHSGAEITLSQSNQLANVSTSNSTQTLKASGQLSVTVSSDVAKVEASSDFGVINQRVEAGSLLVENNGGTASIEMSGTAASDGTQTIMVTNDVTIESTVTMGSARIASNGAGSSINIGGNLTLRDSDNSDSADLTFTQLQQSSGSLNVGGKLTLDGGVLHSTALVNTTDFEFKHGKIDGPGSLNTSGTSIISGAGEKKLTSMTWDNAGTANWQAGDVQLDGADINNLGTFKITGNNQMLDAAGNGSKFQNSGQLEKLTGTGESRFGSGVAFTNNGTLTSSSGNLAFSEKFTQTGGTTDLNGGNIVGDKGFEFNSGSLVGSGSLTGDVNLDAVTVAPGHSPGTLNINGDLVASNNTVFNFELGGVNAGEYDVLSVSGDAALAGTMNVNFINGYTPVLGANEDSFDLINSGSLSGGFTTVNTGTIGSDVNAANKQSGNSFNVTYGKVNTPDTPNVPNNPVIPSRPQQPGVSLPPVNAEPDLPQLVSIPPDLSDLVVVMFEQVPLWPEEQKERDIQMCSATDTQY